MTTEERIAAFEKLGKQLAAIDEVQFREIALKAIHENSWFTEDSVRTALAGIVQYLSPGDLRKWTAAYALNPGKLHHVAVVPAGNIPLVGFHDFLAVLISGHAIQIKPSSKDTYLMRFVADALTRIEPRFRERIAFVDQLKHFDAVIATGSDNSARYFQYYFGRYPHIIRKNRTSCAVINGKESDEALAALGHDVFTYYGLGCRNVSKLFIPEAFDLTRLSGTWAPYESVMHHHKYHNNYDYQKSILLVNQLPFIDTGFVLLQENEKLVSPISVVYYERYHDNGDLALKLTQHREKVQCVVGSVPPARVSFGQAQTPRLWDYADQVDTLAFLDGLR